MAEKKMIKDIKQKTLLLIEDDDSIALAYKRSFIAAGFIVFHISNGEEAISLIKKVKPDIILLDLIMPKRNGFEVLEDIEQNPELKFVPVIILSNLVDEFYAKDLQKYKVAANLKKSDNSLSDIIKKMNSILIN